MELVFIRVFVGFGVLGVVFVKEVGVELRMLEICWGNAGKD